MKLAGYSRGIFNKRRNRNRQMLAITKIKKDMEYNRNFASLMEVLKGIAASQFQALEKKLTVFAPFDEVLQSFFGVLKREEWHHPFSETRLGPSALIAVTSDQGLLGGLNLRVITTAVNLMQSKKDILIVVGEKGQGYARDLCGHFTAFPGIQDDQREAQAVELRNYLFRKAQEEKITSIRVVYPRALTLVHHRIDIATLLPFSLDPGQGPEPPPFQNVVLESSVEAICEYLIFLSAGRKLGEIFGLSRLAEMAARYTHLEEASQKIQALNQKFRLRYFRLRHEAIDQSMREIFSARAIHAR